MIVKMNHLKLSLLFAFSFGCSEVNGPTSSDQGPAHQTVVQEIVDPGAPNWMIAGEDGLLEMAGGTDGEPETLTGRFVFDGRPITAASADSDRWIVVGGDKIQAIDTDALRIREVRDVLSGESIWTIDKGPIGWLIGGTDGRVQLLDAAGEPGTTSAQLLENATITAAAWNGNSWLIGSAAGHVVKADDTLTTGDTIGVSVVGGAPVVDIVIGSAPMTGQATDWYVFSADSYERVTAGGTPQGAHEIEAGLQITAANFLLDKIVLGTSDGRVGIFSTATNSVAWNNVFANEAISAVETDGTNLLALGVNGSARLLDENAAPVAAATTLTPARTLVAGWFTGGRWLIVVGDLAVVEFVGPDLGPLRSLTPVLDGEDILGSDASAAGILLAGANGRIQLVDDSGAALSSVMTVGDGSANLNAASWNGDKFLVVGDHGLGQLVNADGSLSGSAMTLLEGIDLHFAAWSGEYWLVGGGEGKFGRLRSDGQLAGAVDELPGATSVDAARFSGRAWLVGGTDGTNAVYGLVNPDGTTGMTSTLTNFPGTIHAVEFNGLEWVIGGTGGLVQRLSAEGQVVSTPVDVLNSYDIQDIYFNGINYFVTGRFGAVRRLTSDAVPLRTPISVLDLRDARTVVWTRPRGFAGGVCLSNDTCYKGPCVGGLLDGQCCDSACDRACESCFKQDTGVDDGTCAPVVAGKQPPRADGCTRASEVTCGFTGACDGAGSCQFYGAEVTCGEAACVSGQFTADASCDGAGMCEVPETQDCRPYAGCTPEGGCATACGSNADCVRGFECKDAECVEPEDMTVEPKPGDESSDDGGCCATVHHRSTNSTAWLLGAALFGLTLVFRRNR